MSFSVCISINKLMYYFHYQQREVIQNVREYKLSQQRNQNNQDNKDNTAAAVISLEEELLENDQSKELHTKIFFSGKGI